MWNFKALISAVTLLAIATNPVAAVIGPCCCTKPVAVERACCEATRKLAAADRPACCAKKHASTESSLNYSLAAGCCCFKVPPASPPVREKLAQPTFEQQLLPVAAWPIETVLDATADGRLDNTASEFVLSGPPILALYCIWLK